MKINNKLRLGFKSTIIAAVVTLMAFSIPVGKAFGGELVIYSGRHYVDTIMEDFTKQTGIKLTFHRGGSVELFNRMMAEGGQTPADLIITVDAGTLERARIAGALHPMTSETINRNIPAALRAPDNSWVGLTKRTRVIAYNPELVTQEEIKLLNNYAALTLPQFQGRLGIRTGSNVYPQSHAAMMIAQKGEAYTKDWLQGLVRNAGNNIYPSDMRAVEAVAAGEVHVALVNNYYVYRGLLNPKWNISPSKLAYIVPEQGPDQLGKAFNISGIAISAHSKNKENAVKFVEFLTGAKANSSIATGNHEYPANPTATALPQMRPVTEVRLAPVPLAVMARYMVPAIDLIDTVGYR